MSTPQLKARVSGPRPASIDEFFAFSRRRAPGPPDYRYDELIDARPLRAGEMLRVLAIIRGDRYRENDPESAEERCAAAYVAAKLGLAEALPVLRKAAASGIPDPVVEYAIIFALECIVGMEKAGAIPGRGSQLLSLLRMRESNEPAERRFADIVLDKAAIRYGTLASW
jgi:hypothetical protein